MNERERFEAWVITQGLPDAGEAAWAWAAWQAATAQAVPSYVERDAARYRWLRENMLVDASDAPGVDLWEIELADPGVALDAAEVFDSAVDAARQISGNAPETPASAEPGFPAGGPS